MGDRSSIEWCDATWNPISGCTPVSAGCANCYAARMARRFGSKVHGPYGDRSSFHRIHFNPSRLNQPLRWKKPRRIFVCSMGDLFHEDVTDLMRDQVLDVSIGAPQHTYMILTKRPERMHRYFDGTNPGPNIWLGVTAENQEMADQRIPILLQTPAVKRFVSVEPCLGPVDLTHPHRGPYDAPDSLRAGSWGWPGSKNFVNHSDIRGLDWVICGGESGPGARPMHPDWPRSIRDQCQAAGVPFFFKRWGSHMPQGAALKGNPYHEAGWNVKAKNHGCLLDGKEWKEVPR